MTPERYLEAILSPLEGSAQDAARYIGASIATLAEPGQTAGIRFYVRTPPTPLIARTPNLVNQHPTQVWVRYPGEHVAFIVTSLKGPDELGDLGFQNVYMGTTKFGFDIFDSDYLIATYVADAAFVFVLGIPDFVAQVEKAGLTWTDPPALPA